MTYSVIRHSAESSDDEMIIDEGVEIIEAPYPEHGKAQVPKRCFIYDDADGYPKGYEGYVEHSDMSSILKSETLNTLISDIK